jgi:hypothetical protein
LDGLACRRKTGCVDFNRVHYDTTRDSRRNGDLTGTEVMEARDFSTKAKEREFAAAARVNHRRSDLSKCHRLI